MEIHFFTSLLFYLSLVAVLVPLLERLFINRTVGFIFAGVIFGPTSIAIIAEYLPAIKDIVVVESNTNHMIGELGIIFMLFMIGLELSIPKLITMRAWVLVDGSLQIFLSISLLTVFFILNAFSLSESIFLAMALSFSSTIVVVAYLEHISQLGTMVGQRILSILLFQDLFVIPTLVFLELFASSSQVGVEIVLTILEVALISCFVITALYLLGIKILNPIMRVLIFKNQTDSFYALLMLVLFGMISICQIFGVSSSLGALVAGLLFAETEFKHAIASVITPFKGLLLGVFFISIGMSVNLSMLIENPLTILFILLGVLTIKSIVIIFVGMLRYKHWSDSTRMASVLSQGSEFSLVVLSITSQLHLLSGAIVSIAYLVVVFSLISIHPIANLVFKYFNVDKVEDSLNHQEISNHVVLVGFGRVGQLIGTTLKNQGISFIALEKDLDKIKQLKVKFPELYYGGPNLPGLISRMKISEAKVVVLTMDNADSTLETLIQVRKESKSVKVIVRAKDEKHANELRRYGATILVTETFEMSMQLLFTILDSYSFPESGIQELLMQQREVHNNSIEKKD
ncbi:MAG: cation:proton antiporter [Methylacidiphilales bacterium]|nr:cation:proton antiporter [Candidatus Methylacidiphilales bacterium]